MESSRNRVYRTVYPQGRQSRLGPGWSATWLAVAILLFHTGVLVDAQDPNVRRVTWADLNPATQSLFGEMGMKEDSFAGWLDSVAERTERRVNEGILDHVVHYVLQSREFTNLPAIEPTASAREVAASMSGDRRDAWEKGEAVTPDIPKAVAPRMRAFLEAPASDASVRRKLLMPALSSDGDRQALLNQAYFRAMRFLYVKEVAGPTRTDPHRFIAELYTDRGLSADTSLDASYTVAQAIEWLRQYRPNKVRRVLVVGPGLDLAPRTALKEGTPPQSFQPWAVADALVEAGLSKPGDLAIDCADVNPLVIDYFTKQAPRSLELPAIPVESNVSGYAETVGRSIGTREGRSLKIAAEVPVRAFKLNAILERIADGPKYDLIVATNVLLYFNQAELLLAFANLGSMLSPQGAFIHNEERFEARLFGNSQQMPVNHLGTVILNDKRTPKLIDRYVIHALGQPTF